MLKITNPATGATVRELPEDDATLLAEKYRRARDAQPEWAARPLADRLAVIRRFREIAVARSEALARTLTVEVGKPITQARNELKGLLPRIDFFLEHVAAVRSPDVVLDDGSMRETIAHEPLGVVGNISAWNYPYFVGANVFLPALLTGNAVLYKPSEFASLTGLEIASMLHEAGVPRDVFAAIIGGGSIGAQLLEQSINGIFFTGSYSTGKKIAEAAGRKMIRLQMELGGKDPIYVAEDVDVRAAAEATADGAFYNTGQSCCSVERIYVHSGIFDTFVEAFMNAVKAFVIGDPMDDQTYLGPLTRQAQIAVLEDQILDAVAKGAKVLCGGKRIDRPGFFFEPTVIVHTNHSMAVMREETFGPVIGIQQVSDDAEALRLMNDSAYGLTAGVYTRSQERARRILAGANAGSVYWNCCDRVSPRLPWSGRGHSGIGVTLSKQGILAFLQPKAWHLRAPR